MTGVTLHDPDPSVRYSWTRDGLAAYVSTEGFILTLPPYLKANNWFCDLFIFFSCHPLPVPCTVYSRDGGGGQKDIFIEYESVLVLLLPCVFVSVYEKES